MLLIIQSIIVYGFIIWVMTYCAKIAYRYQYPQGVYGGNRLVNNKISFLALFTKNYFFIPIFIFCLFAALRLRVGVDCESYKLIFYDIGLLGASTRAEDIELGFYLLSKFVYYFTASHYLLFFIMAFLQIAFYYFAFRYDRYILVFFGLALFLTGHFWTLMNGMRQNVVACAFVSMIPLIYKKKWFYFAIAVYFASFMHKSAFFLLPLGLLAYFLPNKIFNDKLQLIILGICFLLMDRLKNVLSYIAQYASYAGYSESRIDAYSALESTTYTFGFRMYLLYFSYIMVILYSKKMTSYFNSRYFTLCYNLFFIGICLNLLFYNDFTLGRLLYYLVCFVPIVLSGLLFYLWNNKQKFISLSIILLLLVRTIYEGYDYVRQSPLEPFLYKFDF